jgi:hypothetical protein
MRGPFRSLQILKLREQIESNSQSRTATLNEVWALIKASGAPLVEPDPSDERFQYATFLWQGKPEHKNVLVL